MVGSIAKSFIPKRSLFCFNAKKIKRAFVSLGAPPPLGLFRFIHPFKLKTRKYMNIGASSWSC